MGNYPRVVVDIPKLKQNAETVLSWCRAHGVEVSFVGKCLASDPQILSHVAGLGFSSLADSRIENLNSMQTDLPKMLLRIGMPSCAEEIVQTADISLQSELCTLVALNEEAKKHNIVHQVILMIDLGDLREGVMFGHDEEIMALAEYIIGAPHLILYGIGTNLTCYGSVLPSKKNLTCLCRIAQKIEKRYNIRLAVLSGGNSSSLSLMREGSMPLRINHLRVGETILLGTDTATGKKFEELCDDAFVLEAEVVEVKDKPSYPIGKRALDAMGKKRKYKNIGIIRHGVVALGRQDVPLPEDLIPMDSEVTILGGSSDHLIVNLGKRDYQVGDVLRFKLSYGALLGCFTSRYVHREIRE